MKPCFLFLGLTFSAFLTANSTTATEWPDGQLAISWNETILAIAESEDKFLTLKGLRTATMAHIAIHDALNSVSKTHEPFAHTESASGADPIAASTQAAFTVAINHYPEMSEKLTQLNTQWLSTVNDTKAKEEGIGLGRRAAEAMIQQRENDGWDAEADYKWHPMAPGVYAEFNEHSGTPEGFIFGAGWAKAKGFALLKPDQFRSPAPPAINSDAYAEAYNEVRELGQYKSKVRTDDQTHQALWWKDFAENSFNRLARDLAVKKDLDLAESNRLLALLNMSIFDAYISAFDSKYHHNHWRPYTAIRWAENDGNENTNPDKNWNNTHLHTYAFPSYPSAHGTACAAGMQVFSLVLGANEPFSMTTEMVDSAGPFSEKMVMDPATRKFTSFSEAAEECALSRVYLGIHFRYDSVEATKMGERVGSQVMESLLLPVEGI